MSYTVIDAIGNALDGRVALTPPKPWTDNEGTTHELYSGCCEHHPKRTVAMLVYEALRGEGVVLVLQTRLDELVEREDWT